MYSQINKGNFLITSYGNYSKTQSDYGVSTNYNLTSGKYLDIGTSAGYFLNEKLCIGVALSYNRVKESRVNYLNFKYFQQEEWITIKSGYFLPSLYLSRYYKILNNFYLSTSVSVSYSKIQTNFETYYVGYPISNSNTVFVTLEDNELPYAYSVGYIDNYDYSGLKLTLELSYFFNRYFEIYLI